MNGQARKLTLKPSMQTPNQIGGAAILGQSRIAAKQMTTTTKLINEDNRSKERAIGAGNESSSVQH